MLILFDHSVPAPLRHHLKNHTVAEALEHGWDRLSNGDLLREAEAAEFEVLLTADKNIRYQQNLTGRRIAIVENQHPALAGCTAARRKVVIALDAAAPGTYTEVNLPV